MGFFDKPEVISPGGDGRSDGRGDGGEQARVAELERRVARLEAQVAQLLAPGPAGAAPTPAAMAASQPLATAYWMADVQALKSGGKLIHAIKLYRERTGVGLKEAKDAVEAMPG